MVVLRIQAELWLNGGRVNAVFVKTITNGASKLHVSGCTLSFDFEVNLDVQTGYKLGVAQLPHMKVVAADNARQKFNIFSDLVNVKTKRDSLQKDTGGGLAKWNCRGEDDDSNEERDGWIKVETPGPVSKPDEKCGSNDTNIAQSVTHYVEEDATHVQIVRMTTFGVFFGLGMVVGFVADRFALLGSGTIAVGGAILQERLCRRRRRILIVNGIFSLVISALAGLDLFHSTRIDNSTPE